MSKPYKKRVIQADSDESDNDQPQLKRPKGEEGSPEAAADAPVAVANGDLPSGQVDTVMNGDTLAALDPKSKLAVFTTGSDSEDDVPLAVATGSNGDGKKKEKKAKKSSPASDSEDEKPLAEQIAADVAANVAAQMQVDTAANGDDESSEDEKPLAQVAKQAKRPRASTSKAKAKKQDSDEEMSDLTEPSEEESDAYESESDAPKKKAKGKKAAPKKKEPAPKKEKKAPVKKPKKEESGSPAPKKTAAKGKGKAKKEEDDEAGSGSGEDEGHKWWENQEDTSEKWQTLEHNGVMFPPEYEPHGVKMKYDGKPVSLPPEAEEVATFFAAILETDHYQKPTFVKNFFADFQKILKDHPPTDGTKIKDYEKCDFTPIHAYLEAEKDKKKQLTAAQKKVIKAEKDKVEEKYKTCVLDGRTEKVGNFRIEPPGLFRGRGEHPKTGMLKTRVRPEQITINIGKGAEVPKPPPGHKWKSVVHDNKVTWLATWKENINGNVKYVFLAAGSSLKGQSDLKKFEKARALKEHVDRVRADYTDDLKSKEMATRQRATAVYLIDRFALRAGNEKGEDEADTVGCCSLRYEHVTLTPPNKVTFDFLGKDSIRYVNEVAVDDQVFKNLKIFKKDPKTVGDLLFDRLSTSVVNKYLTSYMDGLTAKVFRTYNASWTFVQQLKDTPADASVADKLLHYNRANRMVAVLCNHQRSVSKGHTAAMEKMMDKIRALKYQRMKLRKALMANAEKPKKYKEDYGSDESDIDDEWIVEHEAQLVVLEREKIRKKFERENKKLEDGGEKAMPEKELTERLKAADDFAKKVKKERKAGYTESNQSEEKLYNALKKMDERIAVAKTNALDKDEGKEISLGTSKINYIDPRISVAWCKKFDVPLQKVFSKTLLEKFTWATQSVEADFEW
ncbi:hypothetical protein JCM10213_007356 [Rhodosporidiobolus nylandii]